MPFSTVAIDFSSGAAPAVVLVVEMTKLPATASVLQSAHSPLSIAGNFMMPSGKSAGMPPASGGAKARPVNQLGFGNTRAPGFW